MFFDDSHRVALSNSSVFCSFGADVLRRSFAKRGRNAGCWRFLSHQMDHDRPRAHQRQRYLDIAESGRPGCVFDFGAAFSAAQFELCVDADRERSVLAPHHLN